MNCGSRQKGMQLPGIKGEEGNKLGPNPIPVSGRFL